MKIGVVGFSRNQFDRAKARSIIKKELQQLAQRINPSEVELVSGYTNSGVPQITYEEGRKLGFILTGFSAKQALRVRSGVYPVDQVILKGERFGDESVDFVNYIDGMIRVGGGPQSRHEVALFRERFKDGTLDRRLREYEVDWFGSKPPIPATTANSRNPEVIVLPDGCAFSLYRAVKPFSVSAANFKEIWNLHPEDYHTLVLHGKEVKTPRWQQAYGKNYQYSGSRNNALPIPDLLQPYLTWCQQHIDPRLNGLLLNWYEGKLNHYIGAHRDSTKGLLPDSPIVTISLGEERIFRLRPYGEKGYHDVVLRQGDVLVIPGSTNSKWTHEVPKFKKYQGKRISVTLRAYT